MYQLKIIVKKENGTTKKCRTSLRLKVTAAYMAFACLAAVTLVYSSVVGNDKKVHLEPFREQTEVRKDNRD